MKRWSAAPYILWSAIFVVVPLFLVLFFSLVSQDAGGWRITLEHFGRFLEPVYISVFIRSMKLAVLSTLLCILFGYPAAMFLSKAAPKLRNTLILLFILPMWMNFLLRTYAWMTLLEKRGLINAILAHLSLPAINILYTDYAVMLGMVYNFLPFMILPIYSVLMKMDRSLLEAAEDLGADSWTSFRRVTFPLSLPGVYAGMIMVFMPAVTTFVISRLLGGGQYMLIGNVIEEQFLAIGNWSFGSAVSVLMMAIILVSMIFLSRYSKEGSGGGMFF